ncbi:HAMP domain-containing histidine kinase [Prolixibacteraceae bacterium JC049]|nr:HAMP domain-containing histidine kinase [Prolixibacteraceae bacterium JC049]
MNRHGLKILVVLMVILVSGIIGLQMFLYQYSLHVGEKKFHQSVGIALHEVAFKVLKHHDESSDSLQKSWGRKVVEKLSNNYYVVNLNGPVHANLLEHYLIEEFARLKINTDFEYALYDCNTNRMVYGNYISATDGALNPEKDDEFPVYEGFTYYFGIFFPSRSTYFNSELKWWYLFTSLLLGVVLFFGYTIFLVIKHRRLTDTQKSFINNMTHEFKTPLASIALAADGLNSNSILKEPERMQQYAKIVKDQSLHLRSMTDRIIESTLAGHKKMQLKLEMITINEIIEKTIEQFPSNSIIKTKLLTTNQVVLADRAHLTQMVHNLLDNAVKYSSFNSEVVVALDVKDGKLCLSVSDEGIGIERKYKNKIFKQFFRVPTGDLHNVKGFGLGLNYVKNICDLHHWSIDLKSESGKGSCFTIKMPIYEER